jgi:hypothetical protein
MGLAELEERIRERLSQGDSLEKGEPEVPDSPLLNEEEKATRSLYPVGGRQVRVETRPTRGAT